MKKLLNRFFKWIAGKFEDDEIQYPVEPKPTEPVEEVPTQPTVPNIGTLSLLKVNDHGIDISHHNSSVDLLKVKEGQKFVIMKATEGANFVSSVYHARMDKAIALNINCGAYHYFKTNADWKTQADHFLKHYKGGLPPVLDVEGIGNLDYSAAKHTPMVLKILKYFKEKTGVTPIYYGGYYFTRDTVKPGEEFKEFFLWLPWYGVSSDKVKVPAPFPKVHIHQYSETAQINGVGKCDANIFLGL